MSEHDDIYLSSKLIRITADGVKTYHFDSPRWIYACPGRELPTGIVCRYAYPFDTREQAEAQRAAHNVSAHHEQIGDINWSDYFGAAVGGRMRELARRPLKEAWDG